MKNLTLTLLAVVLIAAPAFSQCEQCKEALKPLYNYFDVKSDKEYLQKLSQVFQMNELEYNNYSKQHAGHLELPSYGSANYQQAKSNISMVQKSRSGEANLSLDYNEHLQLSYAFVSTDGMKERIQSFGECMAGCTNRPYLKTVENSTSNVILNLVLPLTSLAVKALPKITITSSPHIELIPTADLASGRQIKYGESYTLNFRKLENKPGTVSVNLSTEQNPINITIDAISDEPVYQWVWSSNENGELFQYTTPEIDVLPHEKTPGNFEERDHRGNINTGLSFDEIKPMTISFKLLSGGVTKEGSVK